MVWASVRECSLRRCADCTLPSGAVIDIVDGPGRSETFILHVGNRTFASGHVAVGNVTLTVPGANCKVSSPPAR